ncbi:TPA: fimbria/pilus periplasmic chaperone, partial [Enterobacter asburiae]|nr:fimbria/pilus periplasmic chaperone [Enterobacter asburiae]
DKNLTIGLNNNSQNSDYLAKIWIEDETFTKNQKFIAVTPPLVRVDSNASGIFKLTILPAITLLPHNKETIFYLNLQEIPQKTKGDNILQIAFRSKIKVIYRPKALYLNERSLVSNSWLSSFTVTLKNGLVELNNPGGYFLNLKSASFIKNLK